LRQYQNLRIWGWSVCPATHMTSRKVWKSLRKSLIFRVTDSDLEQTGLRANHICLCRILIISRQMNDCASPHLIVWLFRLLWAFNPLLSVKNEEDIRGEGNYQGSSRLWIFSRKLPKLVHSRSRQLFTWFAPFPLASSRKDRCRRRSIDNGMRTKIN
jgi:hypothetical protein